MAEIKTIAISDINVGERLREIEEDHAKVIASSISEIGLQSPITVRPTPASKGGKYTLVMGAHRLRGAQIAGLAEIDAFIVKADGRQAQLLEISENLFRNELSVIDRAVFVQKYRELWEEENGEIKAGRPEENRANLAQFPTGSFSEHVAERLGVSERSAKRLDQLARHLHPELKSALRGTSIADNQSVLLKLAKMEPAQQRRAAIGWRQTSDIKQVFRLLQDKPTHEPDESERLLAKLIDIWERASPATRAAFLDHINRDDAEVA
jgi:ParB family chromosome partitioning protein